ncbi:MAG: hypothetical protein ACLFWG_11300, partial [Longimicrobiales bacterium]
ATERSPGRAALVGLAGTFLLIPAYVLGIVVLAVSIVGIPFLLLWIPLFPLAAVVAAGLGYLAVAVLLGRWIIRQDFRGLDFLERENDLHAAATGLGALLIPYAIANVILLGGPWLGAIHGLFSAVGILAGCIALIVGFGGVLLTRGGRRPAFVGGFGEMHEPGTTPWGAESVADPKGAEWEEDWDEEWKKEWDEEWEDLEREAGGRTRDDSSDPGSETPGETGTEGGRDDGDGGSRE